MQIIFSLTLSMHSRNFSNIFHIFDIFLYSINKNILKLVELVVLGISSMAFVICSCVNFSIDIHDLPNLMFLY